MSQKTQILTSMPGQRDPGERVEETWMVLTHEAEQEWWSEVLDGAHHPSIHTDVFGFDTVPGPGFVPLVLSSLLSALCIAELWCSWKIPDESPMKTSTSKLPLLMLALCGLYAVLVPVIGFFVSSFLFMMISGVALGARRHLLSLLLFSISLAILFLIFTKVLLFTLPAGLLL